MADFMLHKGVFLPFVQEEVLQTLRGMKYRPCPPFLGSFNYSRYRFDQRLPIKIEGTIARLQEFVPEQGFNTVFIQHYPTGSFVKRHKDPRNNVGKTVIAVFGRFHGALSLHGRIPYTAESGDVVVQDCTIDGHQGEWHSVDKVIGERYAIILNTIL